ncbi:MAG: type IV pilin [Candidatus Thermoplasmatota archaeon]
MKKEWRQLALLQKKYQSDRRLFQKDFRYDTRGVSEVVGTMLLVTIGVALFIVLSVVVFSVLSVYFPQSIPKTSLLGTVDIPVIYIHHYGGESITGDCIVTIAVGEHTKTQSLQIFLGTNDVNQNNMFDIGESFSFDSSLSTTFGLPSYQIAASEIVVTIFNPSVNAVIYKSILQEGLSAVGPVVTTLPATSIAQTSAIFHMSYDFKFQEFSGRNIRFIYWKSADPNNKFYTSWYSTDAIQDFYDETVGDLDMGTRYHYQAQIKYTYRDDQGVEQTLELLSSSIQSFSTLTNLLANWKFDEGQGLTAFDSGPHQHHGELYPDNPMFLRPQWQTVPDNTVKGGSALELDGYDDYISIDLSQGLINPVEQMTCEGWVKPGEHADGKFCNVPDNVFNSFSTFGNSYIGFYETDCIYVGTESENITLALAGRTGSTTEKKGAIVTLKVKKTDFSGQVLSKDSTTTYFDVFIFELGSCQNPKMFHISGDIFGVIYTGPSDIGRIKTFQISAAGDISDTPISEYVFSGQDSVCFVPDIVYCSTSGGNYFFACVYATSDYRGIVKTFSISQTGSSITSISHVNMYTTVPVGDADNEGIVYAADIAMVDSDTFVVVYEDFDHDGRLRSFNINPTTGAIVTSSLNACLFDDLNGVTPQIIKVSDTGLFAIVYYAGLDDEHASIGRVVIVEIPDTGVIDSPPRDDFIDSSLGPKTYPSIDIEGSQFSEFRIVRLSQIIGSSAFFAVSFRGVNNYAYLDIINVTMNHYSLNGIRLVRDNFIVEQSVIGWPVFVYTNYETPQPLYAMFCKKLSSSYSNDDNNGIIKTLTISVISETSVTISLIDSAYVGCQNFFTPDTILLSHDTNYYYYAVVCRGENDGGYIKTFAVNKIFSMIGRPVGGTGVEPGVFIDVFKFADDCFNPRILRVHTTVYAIVYQTNPGSPSSQGYIVTVQINDNGIITHPLLDGPTLFVPSVSGITKVYYPKMYPLENQSYIVCYGGLYTGQTVFVVQSCQITDGGTITIQNDPEYYDVITNVGPCPQYGCDVIRISQVTNIFAFVFGSSVITYSFFEGAPQRIIERPIEIFSLFGSLAFPTIIHEGEIYVLTYTHLEAPGFSGFAVFTISEDGSAISLSTIQFFESNSYISLVRVFEDTFMFHTSPFGNGFLQLATVRINLQKGDVSSIDAYKSIQKNYLFARFLPVDLSESPYKLLLVAQGPEEDAVVHLISLNQEKRMCTIIGYDSQEYNIFNISVYDHVVYASIIDTSDRTLTVSVPLVSDCWNYIVFRYKSGGSGFMTLSNYFDKNQNPFFYSLPSLPGGFLQLKRIELEVIKEVNFYIGRNYCGSSGFNAFYDEFEIYDNVFDIAYHSSKFNEWWDERYGNP